MLVVAQSKFWCAGHPFSASARGSAIWGTRGVNTLKYTIQSAKTAYCNHRSLPAYMYRRRQLPPLPPSLSDHVFVAMDFSSLIMSLSPPWLSLSPPPHITATRPAKRARPEENTNLCLLSSRSDDVVAWRQRQHRKSRPQRKPLG